MGHTTVIIDLFGIDLEGFSLKPSFCVSFIAENSIRTAGPAVESFEKVDPLKTI
jgi:hypothetical protein